MTVKFYIYLNILDYLLHYYLPVVGRDLTVECSFLSTFSAFRSRIGSCVLVPVSRDLKNFSTANRTMVPLYVCGYPEIIIFQANFSICGMIIDQGASGEQFLILLIPSTLRLLFFFSLHIDFESKVFFAHIHDLTKPASPSFCSTNSVTTSSTSSSSSLKDTPVMCHVGANAS